MTFRLYVDGPRWRAHADSVLAQTPGLVPVIKGNGYGFGRQLLGGEATRLGVDTVAVGEAREVASVRETYTGDVLVMTPHLLAVDGPAEVDERVIRTVAGLDALAPLAGHRVVVELLTSMRRFGLTESEAGELADLLASQQVGVRLEGFALHLPLASGEVTRQVETQDAITRLRLAGLPVTTIWVSHLTSAELAELETANPEVRFRSRVGTNVWLGDRPATAARADVLAVHAVRRGDRFGYRQRKAPRAGHLLVVSGGTSHGIALSAPTPAAGIGQRAKTLAIGGLEAAGRSLSPFTVDGTQRWFAEPPHMQVSMLWLPGGAAVPKVGSELDVDVRMTTSTFDEVVVRG